MAIRRLRYLLLLGLSAAVIWLLGAAIFGAAARAQFDFANTPLCIHRSGP